MAENRDYYEILGISRNASDSDIKRAYRKLAKKYHPDSNEGNQEAEKRFKEVTEAYTILSDKEKRKLYDQFGREAFSGTGKAGGSYSQGPFQNGGYQEFHFEGGGMDDILKNFFGGGFGSRGFSGSHFYQGGSGGQRSYGGFQDEDIRGAYGGSQKGKDLLADASISFEEAAFGCEKLLNLSGERGRQTLKVRIPAGIDTGQTVRLRGKGNPGIGGGEPGDLLLKVRVSAKEGWERKGQDVYNTVSIPFATAVFGGEARVQTLYGDVICTIKEGTQSGAKIRLKGKGIPSMKNPSVKGDQYVSIQIQVPKRLTPKARQKLMEYQNALQEGEGQNTRNC